MSRSSGIVRHWPARRIRSLRLRSRRPDPLHPRPSSAPQSPRRSNCRHRHSIADRRRWPDFPRLAQTCLEQCCSPRTLTSVRRSQLLSFRMPRPRKQARLKRHRLRRHQCRSQWSKISAPNHMQSWRSRRFRRFCWPRSRRSRSAWRPRLPARNLSPRQLPARRPYPAQSAVVSPAQAETSLKRHLDLACDQQNVCKSLLPR